MVAFPWLRAAAQAAAGASHARRRRSSCGSCRVRRVARGGAGWQVRARHARALPASAQKDGRGRTPSRRRCSGARRGSDSQRGQRGRRGRRRGTVEGTGRQELRPALRQRLGRNARDCLRLPVRPGGMLRRFQRIKAGGLPGAGLRFALRLRLGAAVVTAGGLRFFFRGAVAAGCAEHGDGEPESCEEARPVRDHDYEISIALPQSLARGEFPVFPAQFIVLKH